MRIEIADDAAAAGAAAATFVAAALHRAVAERGGASVAFSGGRSPQAMLRALAEISLPWDKIDIFQVDERVAPDGDTARNLTALRTCLLDRVAPPAERMHAMPVDSVDLAAAADEYAAALRAACGDPPVLDVAHLGLGDDGHTASLVPGDAALAVDDRDVAIAGPYQGRLRMTLTFPALRRARHLLWLVTGDAKAPVLPRLLDGDEGIPAGRLRTATSVIFADHPAAALARR